MLSIIVRTPPQRRTAVAQVAALEKQLGIYNLAQFTPKVPS